MPILCQEYMLFFCLQLSIQPRLNTQQQGHAPRCGVPLPHCAPMLLLVVVCWALAEYSMANRKIAYTLGRGWAYIFWHFFKIHFPKNPNTAWHVMFMTRHDTPKYGMARHAKIWHGTWNHDMAWHGTGPPWNMWQGARSPGYNILWLWRYILHWPRRFLHRHSSP